MAEPSATPPRTRRAGSLPAFDRLAPPPAEADVRQWIGGRSAASDVVVELHGRGGWVTSAFEPNDDPPVDILCDWIEESYRAVAPKKLVAELDRRADPA